MQPLSPYVPLLILGLLILVPLPAQAYKHVVFMHGIFAGPEEFDYFNKLLQEYHPGTPTTLIDMYNKAESLEPMWTQVKGIAQRVKPILTNQSSEGTVLVCFSQGGLICRGLLSTLQHNVETFISLSCPLAGQYGDTDYLKYFFPKILKENLYNVFYTNWGQYISIADYWNDPHHQDLYKQYSRYLAVLNNVTTNDNPSSGEYRTNFLRLKNLVLIGGPDDGVITPWQSSQFGMYDVNETVLPMEQQEWYLNNAFGLKTMDGQGRIHRHTYKGVEHVHWHAREDVFEKFIKPWMT